MIHIYCIVPAGLAPPAGLRGLDFQPVTALDAGPIAAWASAHNDRPEPSVDAARTHDAVVRAAMDEHVTPVPVRFGQSFSDAAVAADRIGADANKWMGLLAQFAGRAEYGALIMGQDATVSAQDVHPVPPGSGTAYMAALARREAAAAGRRRQGEEIADAVDAHVGALVIDRRRTLPAAGECLAQLAYLVAWNDAPAYHTGMRELREARPELRFVFSGPWPPYSFIA